MDEIYEIRHKIRKVSTDYCVAPLHKYSYDVVGSLVALLRSLNMNTPLNVLLLVDVAVLVVRVVVSIVLVMYESSVISHKIVLYVVLLR